MLDQDTIDNQQALLDTHRRRLAHLLRQQGRLGDYTPPHITLDIEDTRDAIRDLKATLCIAGVDVADHADDEMGSEVRQLPGISAQERRNRTRMLTKVRDFWIAGVLEKSVHGAALIALGLDARPAAVTHPWEVIVQQERTAYPLPSNRRMIDVFDDLSGELLILGAPGSGKTTLLLELARDLISRAEQDEGHPIPVVFNLSSWAAQRRPLAEWLVDELNERYDVPRRVGQAWVDADQILPLLDGLDEVKLEHRAACVEAINAFRRDHGLVHLVVCSRIADYEALTTRLKLQGAVCIQPLTSQQIDTYLTSISTSLPTLRIALAEDATLRELAKSPLMLSVMVLAYQDVSNEALLRGDTLEARPSQLFAAYIDRMFARRGADTCYTRQQTVRWLAWLAHGMVRQAQAVFFIERLQPEWLVPAALRGYAVADRLGAGLGLGIVSGLALWLIISLIYAVSGRQSFYGLAYGLSSGLVAGLLVGLFGGTTERATHPRLWNRQIAADATLGWLITGLCGGLLYGLINWRFLGGGSGLASGLIIGLCLGLPGGLAGALTGSPHMRPRCITLVEMLSWSWSKAWQSMLEGTRSGLIVGLSFGLSIGLFLGWVGTLGSGPVMDFISRIVGRFHGGLVGGLVFGLVGGLAFGLGSALVFSLVFGLLGGLAGGELETTVMPNQGIRRSSRSAVIGGLSGGLLTGLVFGLGGGVIGGVGRGLGAGLVFGLLGGLSCALAYGGYACISHLALRLVL